MDISSRWYGAAGASLIAAGITARYVQKWRRRRVLRQTGRDARGPGGRLFIGLDLSDPYATKRRLCDVAILDGNLHCTFDSWEYDETGTGIVPKRAIGRSFVLAIDGPQGLAGNPEATMRESERLVNAPGRTPYELPTGGRPYEGLITGSVRLFHSLVTSGSRFRLLGFEGIPPGDANLIEVFPGAAWRVVAEQPLPPKRTLDGRKARYEVLQALGMTFDSDDLPSVDQLDAAMAAWVAYCFNEGESTAEGQAPELDVSAGVVREGYVVQPKRAESDEPAPEVVAPV